ncbi:MAG: hypothetical protein U0800_20425 [Isosphaeraceae bacterium]
MAGERGVALRDVYQAAHRAYLESGESAAAPKHRHAHSLHDLEHDHPHPH